MDTTKFLLNKIFKYRNLPDGVHYETNVTAIVNILLEICDIRASRGYIIKDESIMISVRRDVAQEAERKKADKIVLKDVSRPMRNLVVDDEKPLLVIECKSHSDPEQEFTDLNDDQIQTYMSSLKFPYGLLISEYKAQFYSGKYGRYSTNIGPDLYISDILDNINALIDKIKEACEVEDA
ncbi:hypothetical protein CONCODRAFT_11355 [Conidiobolus coronatus NRRL 28638]|jgi:Uma2 family endonuclease|uniref:Type I restriction enzyme R protein N-terminal domain-containing protein n=1 Tax=Conidiobolus coronatus (strain ATCC 28846 / CBS 209.66 / NRRL 28638) TaxID=796925 RepID=A0A137NVH0_CONC2|nr:hypothetical protein CONCODRAFT_11355 [Conidiobolus coronatus NRRL 28638]|eukprot:KXN66708.1 hypothetical protein CONCODRAFT_11355 [Conidiobolus coronatus NRRL 28638]